ncbi:hypothetical protein ACHAXN_011173 [Cyclotella atomus]
MYPRIRFNQNPGKKTHRRFQKANKTPRWQDKEIRREKGSSTHSCSTAQTSPSFTPCPPPVHPQPQHPPPDHSSTRSSYPSAIA